MVGHIAKQRLQCRLHTGQIDMFMPPAHVDQRHGRISKPEQVTPEQVEPFDILLLQALAKQAILEPFNLFVNGLDHRHVVVDDEIEDRIEDVILAMGKGRR
ncbi:hypothetical protein D9M68_971760 [compost metagenome]